jgi:hypothetical protein
MPIELTGETKRIKSKCANEQLRTQAEAINWIVEEHENLLEAMTSFFFGDSQNFKKILVCLMCESIEMINPSFEQDLPIMYQDQQPFPTKLCFSELLKRFHFGMTEIDLEVKNLKILFNCRLSEQLKEVIEQLPEFDKIHAMCNFKLAKTFHYCFHQNKVYLFKMCLQSYYGELSPSEFVLTGFETSNLSNEDDKNIYLVGRYGKIRVGSYGGEVETYWKGIAKPTYQSLHILAFSTNDEDSNDIRDEITHRNQLRRLRKIFEGCMGSTKRPVFSNTPSSSNKKKRRYLVESDEEELNLDSHRTVPYSESSENSLTKSQVRNEINLKLQGINLNVTFAESVVDEKLPIDENLNEEESVEAKLVNEQLSVDDNLLLDEVTHCKLVVKGNSDFCQIQDEVQVQAISNFESSTIHASNDSSNNKIISFSTEEEDDIRPDVLEFSSPVSNASMLGISRKENGELKTIIDNFIQTTDENTFKKRYKKAFEEEMTTHCFDWDGLLVEEINTKINNGTKTLLALYV